MKLVAKSLSRCNLSSNVGQWLLYAVARGHPFDGCTTLLAQVLGNLTPRLSLNGDWGGRWTLSLDAGDISHMIIFEELVIERTWNLDLVPFEPDLIIDAGAHIGFFASLAGVKFPRARNCCIEPDVKNLNWLRLNLAQNNVDAEIFEGVVMDEDGETLFCPGLSYGGHVVSQCDASDETQTVQGISIESILQRYAPNRLLLKIDIEGAEEWVIPPLLKYLKCDCFVFLETHSGQQSFENMRAIFEEAGFSVQVTRSHGRMRECHAVRVQSPDHPYYR
jgi:FkbM family methyltransferase